jgi:predicted RNA methylase
MKFRNSDFEFFVPKSLEFMLADQHVLDLASHTGESSICCSEYGAKTVIGVEPREHLVQQSIKLAKSLNFDNVDYVTGDACNKDQMIGFLKNVDTVVTFGMFYHIADHNLLLQTICESKAKHIILETEFGPETPLPSIDWCVEQTDNVRNGHNGYDKILVGAPNLKWIDDCLSVYGWKIVYFKAFYQDLRQRMILAAVNLKNYNFNDFKDLPDHIWEWHVESNQMVDKKFIGLRNEI